MLILKYSIVCGGCGWLSNEGVVSVEITSVCPFDPFPVVIA